MIKVFFITSEKDNYFGVNQVLFGLKKFLKGKCSIINPDNIYRFIKNKPNIIHIHGCWKINILFYFIVCKFMGIKIIISPHGMLDPHSMKQKKYLKLIFWHLFQKKMFLFSDQIIVNSDLEKRNIRKIVKHSNVSVISHGIELNSLAYQKPKSNNAPLKYVFFSKIHSSKNLHSLINIWTYNSFFRNLELSIYGEITDLNYYNSIKKIFLGHKNIKYHGPIYKNKINILSKYDVFIFPSESENFGIVVLEALASGLYLILNKKLPWHHIQKKYASLINIDKTNLINTIKKLNNKKLLIKKGNYQKNMRLYLKKNYSWEKITNIYMDYYIKI